MTSTTSVATTLVHTPSPSRWSGRLQGVDVLPATATASAMEFALDTASLLIVDDALAFPFEALRDADRDVPLAVRLAAPLDATGLQAVLGNDLLDHLTPLDVVAGARGTWDPVLARRHLPASRWVGSADLSLERLVAHAREWWQEQHEWRPAPIPPGAPLDVMYLTASASPSPQRVRSIKARLRSERDLLRRELAAVAKEQPRTRGLHVGVLSRRPEVWASALPPAIGGWVAVPLVADDERSDDLLDASVPVVALPDHLRLPRDAGELDVVVVVGDLLHNPHHAVERLMSEAVRLLRPGGWLLLLSEIVPDPGRPADSRPVPLGARETVDVVSRASGRQVVLEDLRSLRRPGEDHHRAGLFRWRYLGSERGGTSWM